MQKDFHFYCIAVLARAAGFCRDDALTIAYASQYVDNATEGELIRIQADDRSTDFSIEPVRTAYDLLKPSQGLDSRGWSAQKKVWLPFHFLPPNPFIPDEPVVSYDFLTRSNSSFSRLLLEGVSQEKDPVRRLVRIGVALHAYADTWAHDGFSGRKIKKENDVENLEIFDPVKKTWKKLKIENFLDDLPVFDLPPIGHAEAFFFPDLPYLDWRCTIGPGERSGGRYNSQAFLEAAEKIYTFLKGLHESEVHPQFEPVPWNGKLRETVSWEDLSPHIFERLTDRPVEIHTFWDRLTKRVDDLEQRCKNWEEKFHFWFDESPDFQSEYGRILTFSYQHEAWRRDALGGNTAWDGYTKRDWEKVKPYEMMEDEVLKFWKAPWVHFHRAALLQRHFVIERLP